MPSFLVKRQNFDWIASGQKYIEVRKGKKMKGNNITFLCGNRMMKGRVIRKEQGKLSDIVNRSNFRDVIPVANNLKEALAHIEKLYGKTEEEFAAYYFKLTSKRPIVTM